MEKQHELIPMNLSAEDLAKMPDTKDTKRWTERLSHSIDVLEALYKRRGMDEIEALELATISIREFAQFHGGKQFYLPIGSKLDIAIRDRKIFSEIGRKSAEQLAKEHKITDNRVYQIIRYQTSLIRKKIQPDLF